jgi:hypothetical protein
MRLCIHSRELPNLMLLWMEFVLFSILYALASRKFNPTLQVSKGFYFILIDIVFLYIVNLRTYAFHLFK